MKRSNFLKALLGIAVAPAAIAKAIETETVINPIAEVPEKFKGQYGAKEFKRIWDEAGPYPDILYKSKPTCKMSLTTSKNIPVWGNYEYKQHELLSHYGEMSMSEFSEANMS